MKLFGWEFTVQREKAIPASLSHVSGHTGGWWPIIRESDTMAWQRNEEITVTTVAEYPAVYACATLIAGDIAKMRLRLVRQEDSGIWSEFENPAFSPILRKPNRYQNRLQFVQWWLMSKLLHGNTYALKQRDNRRVVTALYLLDPCRVQPLVAPDGSVYYKLPVDNLSGLNNELIAPASEIIHDVMIPLYHPLCGVSPIYAAGLAALQGVKIQNNSTRFFQNGQNPGGVLSAPGAIGQATADRLKAYWEENFSGENVGRIAVLGDGLKYEAMTVNATDAQLIEQLKWTAEAVCSCFHVPAYMIGVGPPPNYNNIEALNQQYYSQCLQSLIESFEIALDEGLGLGPDKIDGVRYGVEFDVDDLLRMDSKTKMETAKEGVLGGIFTPNEARFQFNRKPLQGGDLAYMQQQQWPLRDLANRPMPELTPTSPSPQPRTEPADSESDTDRTVHALIQRAAAEGWMAA